MKILPIVKKLAKYYKIRDDHSYRVVLYQNMKKLLPQGSITRGQTIISAD